MGCISELVRSLNWPIRHPPFDPKMGNVATQRKFRTFVCLGYAGQPAIRRCGCESVVFGYHSQVSSLYRPIGSRM